MLNFAKPLGNLRIFWIKILQKKNQVKNAKNFWVHARTCQLTLGGFLVQLFQKGWEWSTKWDFLGKKTWSRSIPNLFQSFSKGSLKVQVLRCYSAKFDFLFMVFILEKKMQEWLRGGWSKFKILRKNQFFAKVGLKPLLELNSPPVEATFRESFRKPKHFLNKNFAEKNTSKKR